MREVVSPCAVPVAPFEAHYVISATCRFACSHCPYPFDGGPPLAHEARVDVLKILARHDVLHVLLIAPDCGRIPDLPDTIAAGVAMGIDFDLFVGGPMPRLGFWERVAGSGVGLVMFELFGDQAFHDTQTRTGSFQETLASMGTAITFGNRVGAVVRLLRGCRRGIRSLPDCLPIGVAGIIAQHFIPVTGQQVSNTMREETSLELWQEIQSAAEPTPVTYASCARSAGDTETKICSAARFKLAIRSDGKVLPCEQFRGERAVVGDIRKDGMGSIWSAPLLESIRRQHPGTYRGVCGECEDQERCSVCRALGFNLLGDVEASLPACDIRYGFFHDLSTEEVSRTGEAPASPSGVQGLGKLTAWNRSCKAESREIHGAIPCGLSEIRAGLLGGRQVKRLCVVLGGNGCEWYRGTGGCLMCNFPHKSPVHALGNDDLERSLVRNLDLQLELHEPSYRILCIYHSGSFFSDREVPPRAREAILRRCAAVEAVEEVLVETRCDDVTERKLEEALCWMGSKDLSVGMGLESASDLVRNRILLKGFSAAAFKRAASVVTSRAHLTVYVLVGAPLLSEAERIDDARESISFAAACGAETISLQACNVQPHSGVQWLWERGLYRPPWLWTVASLVKAERGDSRLLVAGREGTPVPLAVASNCQLCSSHAWAELERFNGHQDPSAVSLKECACRDLWLQELAAIRRESLEDRIAALEALVESQSMRPISSQR